MKLEVCQYNIYYSKVRIPSPFNYPILMNFGIDIYNSILYIMCEFQLFLRNPKANIDMLNG